MCYITELTTADMPAMRPGTGLSANLHHQHQRGCAAAAAAAAIVAAAAAVVVVRIQVGICITTIIHTIIVIIIIIIIIIIIGVAAVHDESRNSERALLIRHIESAESMHVLTERFMVFVLPVTPANGRCESSGAAAICFYLPLRELMVLAC